jgi:type VI secretion system protein ImpJ
MKGLARVMWSEGMHLAPHHFQAQSAYFEQVATAATTSLFHTGYGLLRAKLDDEALVNGTVALVSAQGIMPDGVPFSFPEQTVPDPLRIQDEFGAAQASRLLVLALPQQAPSRANVAQNDSAGAVMRYRVVEQRVLDETTGTDARPVQFARNNFQLRLDGGDTPDLVTMPIARIMRDRAGQLRYDLEYVGPCLRLDGSRYLRELVGRLANMLESRAASVAADRATSAAERTDYAPREVASFWFLHALNAALPLLRHWRYSGAAHPEQLYVCLAQLAGALGTFSLTAKPDDVPAYDHDAPEACFKALSQQIQRHLDVFLPAAPIKLELRAREQSFYIADVADARCFEPTATWFLGVRSSAAPRDVATHIKVCSAKVISWLAQKAFAGLTLEPIAVPPAELAPRVGMHYFALRRADPCWKSIVETQQVGLYVPAAVAETELDLRVVVREN